MFDLRTGKLTQLIDSATSYVLWSPSGDRLLSAYASNRSTRIVTRQVSDSARPVHLMTVPGSHLVTEWLRGDTLISIAGGSSADVAILTVQDSMRPKPYLQAPWPETQPRISPDHRYAVHMALADGNEGLTPWRSVQLASCAFGSAMDFTFRTRGQTRPEYTADDATVALLRQQVGVWVNDVDEARRQVRDLYRVFVSTHEVARGRT